MQERTVVDLSKMDPDDIQLVHDIVMATPESNEFQAGETYKVIVSITAKNVREMYTRRDHEMNNEFVAEYDLFGKKSTTTEITVRDFQVTGVVNIVEY